MMANDDFILRGSMRRVQVIRQVVPDDDESAESAESAEKLPITQGEQPESAEKLPISPAQSAESAKNVEQGGETDERGGRFVIKIDEESPNWIQEVREVGGGLAAGPADGVIAKPTGVSDERFATRPEEEDAVEEEPPRTLDDFRAEGRRILDGEADDEFEAEVERTMGYVKRLMVNIERSLFGRKQ